ncbi:MAG: hypothetical protein AAF908_09265 [Pseudomonadota bacterium]
MKTVKTFALTAALAALIAVPAAAQDYNNWSTMTPYGLEMVDPYGTIYYVNPYAYDSQVDVYGNVYSDPYGTMAPSAGMYDLTPNTGTGGGYYNTNPYAGATDSHDKFLEMIWE